MTNQKAFDVFHRKIQDISKDDSIQQGFKDRYYKIKAVFQISQMKQ